MRTVLMLCSRDLSADKVTNQVSAFALFEGFQAGGFPLLLSPFACLVVLEREPNEAVDANGTFHLLLGDRELFTREMAVNFRDRTRTRQMIRLEGLVLPAPGLVTARFRVGAHQAEYTFHVDPPAGGQPQLVEAPVEEENPAVG